VVVSGPELITRVQQRVITLGTCLGAYEAYLVWRGLQTFSVRMTQQTATARTLAAALSGRDDVPRVRYPDLGAMVTITVAGGGDRAHDVVRRLRIGCEATSLGGVETLVSTPFNSSHFSLTPEERRTARIDDGMIRISCGLESTEALVADFVQALDSTGVRG
jgi:cystathionine beta-lyase/cystathionine gamma-synthase